MRGGGEREDEDDGRKVKVSERWIAKVRSKAEDNNMLNDDDMKYCVAEIWGWLEVGWGMCYFERETMETKRKKKEKNNWLERLLWKLKTAQHIDELSGSWQKVNFQLLTKFQKKIEMLQQQNLTRIFSIFASLKFNHFFKFLCNYFQLEAVTNEKKIF